MRDEKGTSSQYFLSLCLIFFRFLRLLITVGRSPYGLESCAGLSGINPTLWCCISQQLDFLCLQISLLCLHFRRNILHPEPDDEMILNIATTKQKGRSKMVVSSSLSTSLRWSTSLTVFITPPILQLPPLFERLHLCTPPFGKRTTKEQRNELPKRPPAMLPRTG